MTIGEAVYYPRVERPTDWARLAQRVKSGEGKWVTIRYWPNATGAPKGMAAQITEELSRCRVDARVVVMVGLGPSSQERPWVGWLAFARLKI